MPDQPDPSEDEHEQTYLELLADYECPDGCDFMSLTSEDQALDILGGDERGFVRCPLCDEELELTLEARMDQLAFVAERLGLEPSADVPGST